jgi:hypothetical protein
MRWEGHAERIDEKGNAISEGKLEEKRPRILK